ncbi:hypothetical protein AQS8620_01021 [Aquimixticola soesokkakensis]|uniref:Peptidoglycan binding-like domain-containing protein n=1 Tax=Aquimixticola soesokkakensis TaxID=1519096 RepID=A0A1Y5S300_9RHOB|nr:peptidoglycan-binding domain-containing protein [Aquimixticola soesokkakensis]SLN31455.1 hypothetical protein AQS8620_01021 [Aquimixticola soesokkakensis]
MFHTRALFAPLLSLGLAGCAPSGGIIEPEVTVYRASDLRGQVPADADPDACFGKNETPAVIETVTVHVLDSPEQRDASGALTSGASYRTETRQEIVRERTVQWFETPCAEVFTPEFTATLQRALSVRGIYGGPISGEMDASTRRAVRVFQKGQGLDSAVLSLAVARKLGLLAVERDL